MTAIYGDKSVILSNLCLVYALILDRRFQLCYNRFWFLETQLPGGVHLNTQDSLRLNVGFMLHEGVGFSRKFAFDLPKLKLEDLELTALCGNVCFTRTTQGLYAQGEFTAISSQQCVRCLEPYDHQLTAELAELFAYSPSTASEPQLVVPATGILDLNPILRESFLLAIPIQPICRPECKSLCPICGGDLNQTTCNHPEDELDPRLSVLQSLLPKKKSRSHSTRRVA
jgi:uncharacterized protein